MSRSSWTSIVPVLEIASYSPFRSRLSISSSNPEASKLEGAPSNGSISTLMLDTDTSRSIMSELLRPNESITSSDVEIL